MTSSTMTLVVCSHNEHKVAEIRELLGDAAVDVERLPDGTDPPEETGRTFAANALIKARAGAATVPGAWILAEDSGLVVDFLVGEPGVHSARYAGRHATDAENNARLLDEMAGVAPRDRIAKFVCVAAVISPDGEETVYRGEVAGTILDEARGDNGFGYDPLFVPDGHEQSFGELPAATKLAISHRAAAMAALLDSPPWE